MANQITDNRTLVDGANATTNWVVAVGGGGASVALDTDVKIEGSGSIAEQISSSRRGCLYNAGATQNWANQVFYVWINCGIVGLLDTKANGGLTIRFTGPSTSDFFEFYVGGNDSWPTSVEGGWTQFVVDIEGTPSNTGGTAPATSAIQHVGFTAVTATVMTKTVDNTWIDEIRRLPDGSPGIIVEGRNGGTTDWDFADIFTQLGSSAGTFKPGPGGSWTINTPLQVGINDTTTHGFSDTDQLILWEDQEWAPSDLYKISALGNSGGTTNFKLGTKSGTGNDAVGAQGGVITAAAAGVRWDMDFNDANLDAIGLYGVQFGHGGAFLLDDAAVEAISCQYRDVSSALVSNSLQLKNAILDANTADGVAFMTTDDLGDIRFCDFAFSDGHAIELTTPRVASQTSTGNRFSGYALQAGTANDRSIYNNTAGAVAISVVSGGSVTEHSYRDGTSASTTVTANISVSFTNFAVGTEIRVYINSTGAEEDGIETTVADPWVATLQSGVAYDIVAIQKGYEPIRFNNRSFSADATVNLNQQPDPNFRNL